MSLKVVNSLRLKASSDLASHLYPFQALSVMLGPSTRMMGPPEMMEAEAAISSAFASVSKWLVREDLLLFAGPTAELTFRRAQTVLDGSTQSSNANAKQVLLAKMDEIRALRNSLSSQGLDPAEVAQQVAPLMEELKVLKEKAGPARFEDVAPKEMP